MNQLRLANTMKTILIALFSLLLIPVFCSAEPQDDFDHILKKAKDMGNTEEGKVYEKHFSKVFAKPMENALKVCTKGLKPPYTVNVVFVIAGDGTVQQIVAEPGELLSAGIAIKLKDLKVPTPPKAGWMVAVNMDVNELKFLKESSDQDQNKAALPGPR